MPQGIYKRTKKHREEFSKNMHSPSAIKKRLETKRKNRELAEKELMEKVEKVEKVEEELKDRENKNKFFGLDREELSDTLVKTQQLILAKVKELAKNMKSLQNLQDERDKIENRLAELGFRK